MAMKNTRNIFGEKIVYAGSITDALNKSQCTILMTHWKQFERFNNNSMKHMSKKFIIDCRRILAEKELQAEYHAIGIGKI
jgi:UDP-glucose 6-dehydrogenase